MSQIEENVVVLVADDEPSTLALVASHVRSRGFKVLEASDGDQAWQLAHEHLPDLVILDVMMPGMSGWEVCRKIREAVSLAHTGVIMLTGIGENLNEMTSPLYGADAYLDKPFEFADLDSKVTATLAERREGAMGRPDAEAVPRRQTEPPAAGANGMGQPVLARPPQEASKRRAAREAAADGDASGRPTKRVAPARATKRMTSKATDESPKPKAQTKAKSVTTKVAAKGKAAKGKAAKTAPAKKSAAASAPKAKVSSAKAAKSAPKAKATAKKAAKAAPAKTKAAPAKASKATAKTKAKAKTAPAKASKATAKTKAKAAVKAKAAAPAKPAPASRKAAPAAKTSAKKANGSRQKRPQSGAQAV